MTEKLSFNQWLMSNPDFTTHLKIDDEILTDSVDISFLLKVKYGQRNVFGIFQNMSGSEVAKYLNNTYNRKWKWLIKFISENYGIGEVNRKTISEQFKNEISGEQSGNVVNKESAFNTDDFVNDTLHDTTGNNSGEQSGNRERTESYSSYYTTLQQLNNADRQDVINIILDDIVHEMCFKIY